MSTSEKPAQQQQAASSARAAGDPTHWDRKTHESIADEHRANWCSQFVYHWMNPLLWLGYKRPLQHSDLGLFYYDEDTAAGICKPMYEELKRQQTLPDGSMWYVMAHTRTWVMIGAVASKLLGDTVGYVPFIGLRYIANYLQVSYSRGLLWFCMVSSASLACKGSNCLFETV